jgi:hypothetical protein
MILRRPASVPLCPALNQVLEGFGIVGLCCLLLWSAGLSSGEKAEWMAYLMLLVGLPFGLALCRVVRAPAMSRFFQGAGALFFLGLIAMNAKAYTEHQEGALVGTKFLSFLFASGNQFRGGVPLIFFLAAGNLAVTWFVAKRLVRREEGRAPFAATALLSLVLYALALVQSQDRNLVWLEQRHLITYALFLLAAPLALWFRSDSPAPADARSRWIWGGFCLGAAVLWVSGAGYSGSWSSFLHWSYYLGPLEWVKRGELLLHDIPSQYGFLSLLFPSWLPWDALNSFRVGLSVVLLLHGAVVYSILSRVTCLRFSGAWAALVTFAVVFLFPGAHEGDGSMAYPSTGGYRFFWVLCFALLLARTGESAPSRRRSWAASLVFAVGCLWSMESAAYCIGTLLACAAAEAFTLSVWGVWKGRKAEYAGRFLLPVACLGAGVAAVEIWYRLGKGIAPDWYAFVEYAFIYSADGFGSLTVAPGGAVNAALACLVLLTSFLISRLWRTRSLSSASLFGIWGALFATFTYYVSRSAAMNVCNLIALWFPLLGVVWRRALEERDAEWTGVLSPSLGFLSLLILGLSAGSLSWVPREAQRRVNLADWANPLPAEPRMQALVDEVRPGLDPTLPVFVRAPVLAAISLKGFESIPWLPAYPWEEFRLVRPERQAIYLRRFLARRRVPAGQMVRGNTLDPSEKSFETLLDEFYERTQTKQLSPYFVLETFRSRAVAPEPKRIVLTDPSAARRR